MTPKTVLVVEDEAALSRILQETLHKAGFEPLAAEDGTEGLELALRKRPDLILLDIMMPHDGLSMLEKLRADEPFGKSVPVILLTNLSPDSDKIISAIEKYEPAFYLVKANQSAHQIVEKVRDVFLAQTRQE